MPAGADWIGTMSAEWSAPIICGEPTPTSRTVTCCVRLAHRTQRIPLAVARTTH
jgi:hypothetical protein